MKLGVMTSGGDSPGMNAAIRAVVRTGISEGYEIVGIKRGWTGLTENITMPMNLRTVSGIISGGGTILQKES